MNVYPEECPKCGHKFNVEFESAQSGGSVADNPLAPCNTGSPKLPSRGEYEAECRKWSIPETYSAKCYDIILGNFGRVPKNVVCSLRKF